jgi:hypothetical protein
MENSSPRRTARDPADLRLWNPERRGYIDLSEPAERDESPYLCDRLNGQLCTKTTPYIDDAGHGLDVPRIAAPSHAAQMVELAIGRNRADQQRVEDAMHEVAASLVPDCSISVVGDVPGPQPAAAIGLRLDPSPYALGKRDAGPVLHARVMTMDKPQRLPAGPSARRAGTRRQHRRFAASAAAETRAHFFARAFSLAISPSYCGSGNSLVCSTP